MRRTLALALSASLVLAASVRAQPPAPTDPYAQAPQRTYWGYNDPLTGYANLLTAQGQFLMDSQRAKLLAEEVNQKKFETRRKSLEHWDWERKFIPRALEEQRQLQREAEIRRIVNDPPPAEIYSGAVLNKLRGELLQKYDKLGAGDSKKIDPDGLLHIHVASTRGGNTGLLKTENNKIPWPLLVMARDDLQGDRDQIEQHLARAKAAVLKGERPGQEIVLLRGELKSMQGRLREEIRSGSGDATWSWGDYIAAMRSLDELKDALVILIQPKAANFLQPLEGKTVAELMTYMQGKGLTFAPATWADEQYYSALYYALRDELKRIDGVPTLDAVKP